MRHDICQALTDSQYFAEFCQTVTSQIHLRASLAVRYGPTGPSLSHILALWSLLFIFLLIFLFSSFSLSKPLMTGRWSHTRKIKNLVVTNNKFFKWDNTEFIAPFSSTGCVILQSVNSTRLSFLIQNAHFMGLLWWSNKVRQSTISDIQ